MKFKKQRVDPYRVDRGAMGLAVGLGQKTFSVVFGHSQLLHFHWYQALVEVAI